MKRVLMIAFHYPPVRGSSGVQRTLSFSRYLLEKGWEPTVLTVSERAFPLTTDEQLSDIPDGVDVRRAFAFDAIRYFSVFGWHPKMLALPDRWWAWYYSGVRAAHKVLNEKSFDLIWSTYPIASAHRIGANIANSSGLPWVADFRDAMFDEWFPSGAGRRNWHKAIEEDVFSSASKVVVTTPGTKSMYSQRYANFNNDDIVCIANGYDERIISEVELSKPAARLDKSKISVLHSGILYPDERDPQSLFQAIFDLKKEGKISANTLEVIFRGSRHDDYYQPIIEGMGIDDIIIFKQGIDYREALKEMYAADALLLLQSSTCNYQVPAKVYEYARVGKPLLALTDSNGDTANFMRSAEYGQIVPLDDSVQIASGLLQLLEGLKLEELPNSDVVNAYSRKALSEKLAELLDSVISNN
ncbi:MAG: glycosyltransferase [Gammaproteobacteria bacterium]|nr:glycosyltransferase [Gammaproteobacteria bacterium]